MNITNFACGNTVFINCECIKGYSFKVLQFGPKSALLQANSAYQNCFECLLPSKL